MTKSERRRARQRKMRIRRAAFTLCLMAVVMVASIGGTIAWLADKADPVVNTFTVGDIDIDLFETKDPNGEETVVDGKTVHVTDWEAQMIPGNSYSKNPQVVVYGSDDNVDCWLFVKFEIENPSDYVEYDSTLDDDNSGWNRGDDTKIPTNVWYREVTASVNDQSWNLLKADSTTGKEVSISEELTESTMPTAAPILTYTAWAVQKDNLTVEEAWEQAQNSANYPSAA